jgi:hypothetical protein
MSGKPANPSLVLGALCTGCQKAIVGENLAKTGKTYLKCPVCKDWNYYNQEGGGQAAPPQQYQTPPQQIGGNQQSWKKTPTQTTSSTSSTLDPSISQGITTIGNRLNSLYTDVFGEEGMAVAFIQRFDDIDKKLDDLSSRFDIFQRDYGVSKEGAATHQNFLLTKKRPRGKEKEEES